MACSEIRFAGNTVSAFLVLAQNRPVTARGTLLDWEASHLFSRGMIAPLCASCWRHPPRPLARRRAILRKGRVETVVFCCHRRHHRCPEQIVNSRSHGTANYVNMTSRYLLVSLSLTYMCRFSRVECRPQKQSILLSRPSDRAQEGARCLDYLVHAFLRKTHLLGV